MMYNIDVLLVNPLFTRGKKHVHFSRDIYGGEPPGSLIYPPLDLAYLAAELVKNNFRVRLVDANALHLNHDFIIRMVCEEKPRFVCIPSAWQSLTDDLLLAKRIKEIDSNIKVILSGPNATAEPAKILDSSVVDYVVLGELEKPVLEILLGDIKYNVAYRLNGSLVIKERKLIEDLDELSFPDRRLLPNSKYTSPFTKANPFTTMNISRGCPYACIFCPHNVWDLGKIRFRSVGKILEELRIVVTYHRIKQIIFIDSTFTVNREFVKEICIKIAENGINFFWRCFTRVDSVDRELLGLMKRAGCHQICYGFESGSERILHLNNKGINIEQSKLAAILTKETGIEIAGTFMIGMHGETEGTFKETLNLALGLNLDFAQFNIAQAVPSTQFFEITMPYKNSSGAFSFNGKMSKYKKICYKKFYLRPSYILKRFKSIRNFNHFLLQLKTALKIFGD